MIKFHDYNPSKPFEVKGEWHYVDGGEVTLNYTPMQGSMKVLLDGVEATESNSKSVEAGQFYIDYSADSDYKMATQKVYFNKSDNGKRATFDYSGVSTLIFAKHFNEIRDFMNGYNEDRARDLLAGKIPTRSGEKLEVFKHPKLTDTTKVTVTAVDGVTLTVGSVEDLKKGETYTLSDGERFEEFEVAAIDPENKTVTAKELKNTYTKGHIYKTTASVVDGKATVLNGSQTVQWDVDEVWKGSEGGTETHLTPVNALSDNMEGVSINSSGEFEVEDFSKKSLYVFSPIYARGTELSYHVNITPEPVAFVPKNMVYSGGYSSIPLFISRSGTVLPCQPSYYFPRLKIINIKQKDESQTIVRQAMGYYIPPLWVCDITHPSSQVSAVYTGLCASEQKNTHLHKAFEKYKDGFYIFRSEIASFTKNPTKMSPYEYSIAVLYTSFFVSISYSADFKTGAVSNPMDYEMKDDILCPLGSGYQDSKQHFNVNGNNFTTAYTSTLCNNGVTAYCYLLSKDEAEKLYEEGKDL